MLALRLTIVPDNLLLNEVTGGNRINGPLLDSLLWRRHWEEFWLRDFVTRLIIPKSLSVSEHLIRLLPRLFLAPLRHSIVPVEVSTYLVLVRVGSARYLATYEVVILVLSIVEEQLLVLWSLLVFALWFYNCDLHYHVTAFGRISLHLFLGAQGNRLFQGLLLLWLLLWIWVEVESTILWRRHIGRGGASVAAVRHLVVKKHAARALPLLDVAVAVSRERLQLLVEVEALLDEHFFYAVYVRAALFLILQHVWANQWMINE